MIGFCNCRCHHVAMKADLRISIKEKQLPFRPDEMEKMLPRDSGCRPA
jgi:hypothetical protein